MGLTDYSKRTTVTTNKGTKITTSTGGGYTTKVYHDASGTMVKNAVYRGDLNGDHAHYNTEGQSRGVLRSDVFK